MTQNTQTLQCSLHLEDINLHGYFYDKSGKIYYKIFSNETPLFSGDHRPSAVHPPFSLASIISLLASIIPSPEEFPLSAHEVARHTKGQLEWYQTPQCTNLYRQIIDYKEGNEQQKAIVERDFKKGFIEYIHPPVFNLYQVIGKQHYCPRRTWYTATIPLSVYQIGNLVRLLGVENNHKTRQVLHKAIKDNFKKVKKHLVFQTVLFEGDTVTLNDTYTTPKPDDILSRLTKPYLKKDD